MSYENVLLNAVSANGTGPVVDLGAGDISDDIGLEVVISGTVTALSVQLQGSEDGSHFFNVGLPVSAAGLSKVAPSTGSIPPCRYFKAVLSSYAGTGTVTVFMSHAPLT